VKNVFMLLLFVVALAVLRAEPILPQQVTLMNALTIGAPALLVMLSKEKAARPSHGDFLMEVIGYVVRSGLVIAAAGLAVMLIVWHADAGLDRELRERRTHTHLLTALVLLGLMNVLRVLRDGEDAPPEGEGNFRALVLAALALFVAVMYLPPLG